MKLDPTPRTGYTNTPQEIKRGIVSPREKEKREKKEKKTRGYNAFTDPENGLMD